MINFLVDNYNIKNFRKAVMCNISEHNILISFFLKNTKREYINVQYISSLYPLPLQPKKASVKIRRLPS